jgi:putative hydrolase of the HAD superfamily
VSRRPVSAVFFDVDFTLIYPGPMFQGEGYAAFCARYGMTVDPERFPHAVRVASSVLDAAQDHAYDADIFVCYTRRIIEEMGGTGALLDECATEIYNEWAACQHFFLYDDVAPVLQQLAARGLKIGLISNSHRCLASFQSHFELDGLISATVSSSDHGFMKPHPRIFAVALELMQVSASESVMVGDSLTHDVAGARRAGMRGILLARGERETPVDPEVTVIRSLAELPGLV